MINTKKKVYLGLTIFFLIGVISTIIEKAYEGAIFYALLSILFFYLYKKKDVEKENKIITNENKSFKPFSLPFVSGLNLPEGSNCSLTLEEDTFHFFINGTEFSLNSNQITDISIKTNKEIEKQYVSSIGGAITGGLLLGPLGAAIGGRAKTKKNIKIQNFLIFTYIKKDNSIDYIVFKITNSFKLNKIKKNIKNYKNNYTLKKVKLEL